MDHRDNPEDAEAGGAFIAMQRMNPGMTEKKEAALNKFVSLGLYRSRPFRSFHSRACAGAP